MRDPSEFDAFYAGSVQRVTSHVYAMTGSRTEAEDLVQEAYTRAWQNWNKVSGYANPEGWVRSVAFRIRISAWRKAVNRATAQRRYGPPEPDPGANPDYVAIIAALRRINPHQRQAVVLYHLVGLSTQQIAEETGVTVGTVKARLSRGRQALAPHLSDAVTTYPPFAEEAPRHA